MYLQAASTVECTEKNSIAEQQVGLTLSCIEGISPFVVYARVISLLSFRTKKQKDRTEQQFFGCQGSNKNGPSPVLLLFDNVEAVF